MPALPNFQPGFRMFDGTALNRIVELLNAAFYGVGPEPTPNVDAAAVNAESVATGLLTLKGRGAQTQATNKGTAVEINAQAGVITMNGAELAQGASVSFALTNSFIAVTDVIVVHVAGGTGVAAGEYSARVSLLAAGSAQITVTNNTGGALSDPVVLNFAVLKTEA